MKTLEVRLYGGTRILADGKEIEFPFMKAALLLIILSDKKSYSRKKLQLMLWHDKNEQKADRNLRNTIYVIKQKLGGDVILTEKNSKIRLNENISVLNDLDIINSLEYKDMCKDDLQDIYSYFSDEIFEDLNFEYGISLDDYIRNFKNIYNENIYRKLIEISQHFMHVMNYENVIITCEFMIKLNEYDEKPYKNLITAYNSLGIFSKIAEIDKKMSDIFGYDTSTDKIAHIGNEYYRDDQIFYTLSEITKFNQGEKYRHIGIKGASGSGKTEILNSIKLQQNNDTKIIDYSISNGYTPCKYEVFNYIINKIRNNLLLDSSSLYDIVANGQKVILIIDNLDLSDVESIEELFNFIIRSENRILLIATYSMDLDNKLTYFLNSLSTEGLFTEIKLGNLNFNDLKKAYANLSDEQINNLIIQSGGNPFLINYLMNNGVTKEMYNAFMSVNLSCKTQTSLRILHLLSIMKNRVDINTLSDILNMNVDKVVQEVSQLINRGILIENTEQDYVEIEFCNNLQKEYICSSIKNIEKQYIHKKIADYYESILCDNYSIDNKYYTIIIYHLTMAKYMDKAFIYKCKQFNKIYNISHEFFPIALDEEYSYSVNFNIDENMFKNKYEELMEEMDNLKNKYSETMLKVKINMLFCYARFYKSIGKFDEAQEKLNEILRLSESLDYFIGIFQAHLQFIQYSININDLKMMKSHLKTLNNDYKDMMSEVQYAIYLRFKGYYDVLEHNFKSGIQKVEEAQEIFKKQHKLYKMKFNIAACSFVKGEAKFLQNEFDDAFEYYMDAISICHDKEIHPSLALLFSRLGLVRLKQQSFDEAKYYFEKSLKQYNTVGFSWGKEQLYSHIDKIYKSK
ncbi:MAG: serine/threonine protein kinase [Peptoanaerobacter stomatis]|uniref:serine/threonine protein kinase n=1 Tax=Peptoanaerobacter stomatis TaxID=796937 RepID=UPI003FA13940